LDLDEDYGREIMKCVALAMVLALLGGCAILDLLTGASPKSDKPDPSSPVAIAAPLVDRLHPGAGAALMGLAGLYAEIRRRRWKAAAVAQMTATDKLRDMASETPLTEDAMLKVHAEEQQKLGVRDMIRDYVKAKIE
jgi:hypothetical protein